MSSDTITIDSVATELWEKVQDAAAEARQIPTATYRIQFNKDFTFQDAKKQIPYLHALGISHIYASPYFRARSDSTHGYDICDHNSLNPSIGSEQDYADFVNTLHQHGMGQILDTVPNHMGIGEATNEYWMDVLENGPSSPYASWFDIDWHPLKPEMDNQVLLPILGAQYGDILERQELRLSYNNGAFYLQYWENQLPVAPRTYTPILEDLLQLVLADSSPEDEHILELQSIMTALSHLPPRTETDPERIAERHREKEIIKRRLNTLAESYAAVAEAIDATVTAFNGISGDPRSFDKLDELVRSQAYRLAYWRVAAEEINYRRFFDINDLAAVRMEQTPVFRATHQLVLQLLQEGAINGLRVDHPDGLWDPGRYFRDVQRHYLLELARQRFAQGAPSSDEQWAEIEAELLERYEEAWHSDPHSIAAHPVYMVAEKILGHGEVLPQDWPVDGTSGYDFLNQVNGLFVESANAKTFETIYSTFIKDRIKFNDLVIAKKKQVLLISLVSELNVLAHQLSRLSERNRYMRDFTLNSLTHALREVIACFPVYRTYIAGGVVPPHAVQQIESAVACAKKRNPVTDPSIFDFIRDTLLLKYPGTADEEDQRLQQDWVQKFQQLTGPVMAKGLEDTTFYIYNRLISLNEVGGEPQRFGTSVTEFHRANAERQKRWPHAMLTTSTHDTKRSEDVRARINVLSEMPREWKSALGRWSRMNRRYKTKVDGRAAPDRNEEYLLYQTLLGAWPHPEGARPMDKDVHAVFVERIQAYMQKAMKEGKVNTSWINPDEAWDAAVSTFIARILQDTPQNAFLEDFQTFAAKIAHYGAFNSLTQTVLKLTSPGVPDIYQGNEMWDLSLVDPDNRRAVNYEQRSRFLQQLEPLLDGQADRLAAVRHLLDTKENGCIKLYVTASTLHFRREQADLFAHGTYQALQTVGPNADHVVAFVRRANDAEVVVAVPRLTTHLTRSEEELPIGPIWNKDLLVLSNAQPGERYENIFTGEQIEMVAQDGAVGLPLSSVWSSLPVAMLVKQS
jgi:(1->4)-alpha-D-glucan 1-alpha-D-glucosylmutase